MTTKMRVQVRSENLRDTLKLRRFTYRDLEKVTGIPKASIAKLATGGQKTCSLERAMKISKYLCVPSETIFFVKNIPHSKNEENGDYQ
ncbi:helix-turn-helix domain-containing protein [Rothia sp. CCM 9418]|uniref:helix-turn-helix domain-containing protein n=1 Tax=Rothia sp. CCM 9418 TaxID=3402661 RepID=UPI003AE0D362